MPYAIEFRSNEDVHPCWLNDGEMNRISAGQRRKESPTPSPRSISSTRDSSSPNFFVSIRAQPTPAAPAPTMITSTAAMPGRTGARAIAVGWNVEASVMVCEEGAVGSARGARSDRPRVRMRVEGRGPALDTSFRRQLAGALERRRLTGKISSHLLVD